MVNLVARARAKRGTGIVAGRSTEQANGHPPLDEFAPPVNALEKSEEFTSEGVNGHAYSALSLQDLPLDTDQYPQEWFHEHPQQRELNDYPTSYPWLMESSALEDLGIGMSALDGEMNIRGTDDFMHNFVGDTSIFESSYRT
jgi:hypothetical protein